MNYYHRRRFFKEIIFYHNREIPKYASKNLVSVFIKESHFVIGYAVYQVSSILA